MEVGKHLSNRENSWQALARETGDFGEMNIKNLISLAIREKGLEDTLELTEKKLKIYNYKYKSYTELSDKWYWEADLYVRNKKTGKMSIIEIKTGNNGGNATQDRATRFIAIDKLIRNQFKVGKYSSYTFFGGKTFDDLNYKGKVWSYFKDHEDIVSFIIINDGEQEVFDYIDSMLEDLLID